MSYVIRYIYGDLENASLDQARANKWKIRKKKSLVRLPPDDDSVTQHIKRANYLANIQRHSDTRMHPSPIGHEWQMMNGRCRPVRHTQPPQPIVLAVPPTQQVDSESDEELDESDELDSDFDFSDADRYD